MIVEFYIQADGKIEIKVPDKPSIFVHPHLAELIVKGRDVKLRVLRDSSS